MSERPSLFSSVMDYYEPSTIIHLFPFMYLSVKFFRLTSYSCSTTSQSILYSLICILVIIVR